MGVPESSQLILVARLIRFFSFSVVASVDLGMCRPFREGCNCYSRSMIHHLEASEMPRIHSHGNYFTSILALSIIRYCILENPQLFLPPHYPYYWNKDKEVGSGVTTHFSAAIAPSSVPPHAQKMSLCRSPSSSFWYL